MNAVPLPLVEIDAAEVSLPHLDALWFQLAGTRCNYTCRHCFISCSPHNHTFDFLGRETVLAALAESVGLGVKEYYFTGGEPFLHPGAVELLERTLTLGPATVLTNASVLKPAWLERLAEAERASPYSLEFRVSLDGFTPETNDPIRGEGTFRRTLEGLRKLHAAGFLPLVTVALTAEEQDPVDLFAGFVRLLREEGIDRPRVKILPTLRLGAEVSRSREYRTDEYVDRAMMEGFDASQLLCHSARVVTDRGVWVCPILLDAPEARLGGTLAGSLRPFALRYRACWTCYQHGSICANPSGGGRDA
jgi:molybdenum cofactor biosynthesis enzyme MoaA